MGELAQYLRFMINADKGAKITNITSSGEVQQFNTQLTSITENTRRYIGIYNNTGAASGECYVGFSGELSATKGSLPIPKGAFFSLPIAVTANIPLFHVTDAGEQADLRFIELA